MPRVIMLTLLSITVTFLATSSSGARARVDSQGTTPTAAASQPIAAAGLAVAVALRGDIYAVPTNGGAPRRLTRYGDNSAPLLSPDGSRVAYLSASPRYTDRFGHPTTHAVWVVPVTGRPDGSDAHKLTVTNPRVDRGGLAWSPDGRRLAYDESVDAGAKGRDNSVVVANANGNDRVTMLRLGPSYKDALPAMISGPIAWSPDGRHIAVLAPDMGPTASWRRLRVDIVDTHSDYTCAVTIGFPAPLLGSAPRPDSEPSNSQLAWTSDGRRLVVATSAAGEGPPQLTGIWQAPTTGGAASLLVGTASGVRAGRAGYPVGAPLSGATHFSFSSTGVYLATDPDNRLWGATADGLHGRYLTVGLKRGCALTQYTWLSNSPILAYVTSCGGAVGSTPPTRSPPTRSPPTRSPPTRSPLYTIAVNDQTPHQLLSVDDPTQRMLDLAPAYRCVQCGY